MRRLLVLVGLSLAIPAGAAGWTAWEGAFPALPCVDGWAACRVGEVALGGGMARDAAGRPLRADARLGWFDLEPTAGFSPFGGLSSYAGAPSTAVATMLAPDAAGLAVTPVAAVAPAPAPSARLPVAPPASAPAPSAVSARPVAPAPLPPAGVSVAAPEPSVTAVLVPPPADRPPAAVPDGCTDLVALEPPAMIGGLPAATVACLEGRIAGDTPQTTRDKLSRLLIVNAEGKGDRAEWERLVKRHLEEIDRSDPDLCFKYAYQLSRGGVGRAPGVIRWAETALENKHRWEGTTYKTRVYGLYRLRAEAAGKLWAAADQEYTTGEHTEENEAKAERLRGMAKDYAREWLDYATASGQDTATATALCVSAAGNRGFCEGG